ncbi:hypothetical protein WN51_04119 [Melipona quadrifasciata]|uniref:Uncharacterized protein n=1 Tax=Melipona quadrifasciata TaxID=166423 RepID=A0A0M8ZSC8_9HYME|nr:hypothetical protein WN51_04119 [Melipona quadrifasciata]
MRMETLRDLTIVRVATRDVNSWKREDTGKEEGIRSRLWSAIHAFTYLRDSFECKIVGLKNLEIYGNYWSSELSEFGISEVRLKNLDTRAVRVQDDQTSKIQELHKAMKIQVLEVVNVNFKSKKEKEIGNSSSSLFLAERAAKSRFHKELFRRSDEISTLLTRTHLLTINQLAPFRENAICDKTPKQPPHNPFIPH